jgi:spore coat polysaccharide biosynthesis protein SpsF (cytidylyltransferase family)
MMGAERNTLHTTNAFLSIPPKLGLNVDPFRIVTPYAVKRAALYEKGRPHAGSVMRGSIKNIKQRYFHAFRPFRYDLKQRANSQNPFRGCF